jgi:hypothetical protein
MNMTHHLFALSAFHLFLLGSPLALFSTEFPMNQYPMLEESQLIPENQIEDLELRNTIREALSTDRELSPSMNQIEVHINGGIVTLEGKLDSPVLKSKLESKVNAITGVKQVINHIEIEKLKTQANRAPYVSIVLK